MDDLEDAFESLDRLSPEKRRIRAEAIIAGVLMALAPFLAARSIWHPEPFLFALAICFVWILASLGLRSPRRDARQRYSQAIDVWPEVEATINQSGIAMKTPATNGEMAWSEFSQFVEGKTTLGLVSNHQMHIFPQRAFDDAQWDKFRKLVHEHVQRVPSST